MIVFPHVSVSSGGAHPAMSRQVDKRPVSWQSDLVHFSGQSQSKSGLLALVRAHGAKARDISELTLRDASGQIVGKALTFTLKGKTYQLQKYSYAYSGRDQSDLWCLQVSQGGKPPLSYPLTSQELEAMSAIMLPMLANQLLTTLKANAQQATHWQYQASAQRENISCQVQGRTIGLRHRFVPGEGEEYTVYQIESKDASRSEAATTIWDYPISAQQFASMKSVLTPVYVPFFQSVFGVFPQLEGFSVLKTFPRQALNDQGKIRWFDAAHPGESSAIIKFPASALPDQPQYLLHVNRKKTGEREFSLILKHTDCSLEVPLRHPDDIHAAALTHQVALHKAQKRTDVLQKQLYQLLVEQVEALENP